MAFTKAAFDVHLCLQKLSLFPLPYKFTTTNLMVTNPLFIQRQYTALRYHADFWIALIFLVSCYRITWLYNNRAHLTPNHMEQAVVYTLIIGGILILSSFFYTYLEHLPALIFTRNQMLQLQLQNRITVNVSYLVKVCLVYGLAFGAAFTAVALPVGAFLISYTPLHLVFGNGLKSNLFSAVIYLVLGLKGAPAILSPVILCLTFLEDLINYSEKLRLKFTKALNPNIATVFYGKYMKYIILKILLVVSANACQIMFTTLIIVGVFITSFAGFGTLQLYDQLNIIVFLPICFLFFVGVFVATVFTALGSIPGENVERFSKFWSRRVTGKLQQRQLKSVTVIGFKLGPYGLATKTLGLLICEDIINNVISLALVHDQR